MPNRLLFRGHRTREKLKWYLPTAAGVAHEIGRVLGLGDDYFSGSLGLGMGNAYKPTGDPLEGGADFRLDGTFTTSGVGAPDPAAIAHVVEQIKAAGLLPQCWKGSFDWSVRQPCIRGPRTGMDMPRSSWSRTLMASFRDQSREPRPRPLRSRVAMPSRAAA
jgi:hypothetical protein